MMLKQVFYTCNIKVELDLMVAKQINQGEPDSIFHSFYPTLLSSFLPSWPLLSGKTLYYLGIGTVKSRGIRA